MRKLLICLLSLVSLAVISTLQAKNKPTVSQSDIAKADMLYLEALNLQMGEQYDAASELLARAFQLNPSDSFVASEYGFALIRLNQNDTTATNRGYALMKQYIQSPEGSDYYNRARLAQVAAILGKNDENIALMKALYEDFPERPEVAGAYADRLIATRRSDLIAEALRVYDTLEVREGGLTLPILLNRVRVYATDNDSAAVVDEMKRGLRVIPPSAELYLIAGQVLENFLPADTSLAYYDKAVELDPEVAGAAYYYRGNLLLQKGDSIGYDREIFKALNEPDLDVDTKIELLRSYVINLYSDPAQRGRIMSLFENMVERHPHEADLHGFYSDYLAMSGNYEKSAEQSVLSLDLQPDDLRRWQMLASIYLSLEDYDKVVETAKKGMRYFPNDEDLMILCATAYGNSGHTRRALDILMPMLDNYSNDPEHLSEILTSIGDIYYKGEQLDSSFVYYEKALKADPDNLTALNNSAYHMACENVDLLKALEMIERVVAQKPDDATSLDTYAWVLFKMRNYDKALEIINKTLENLSTPSAEVLQHAGDIYFMCQQHDEAVEFWEEALELEPDNDLLKRKVKHKTYFPK